MTSSSDIESETEPVAVDDEIASEKCFAGDSKEDSLADLRHVKRKLTPKEEKRLKKGLQRNGLFEEDEIPRPVAFNG